MRLHHSVTRVLLQLCLALALLASFTEALEEQPGVRLFGVGIGVVLVAFLLDMVSKLLLQYFTGVGYNLNFHASCKCRAHLL
jgi:hypothetical protein